MYEAPLDFRVQSTADLCGEGWCVYSLLPRMTYSWGSVAAGGNLELVVGRSVSLREWTEGTLHVRLHENDIDPSAGAKLELVLEALSYSTDDPQMTFLFDKPLTTMTVVQNDGANIVLSQRISSDFAEYARLKLRLVQATNFQLPNRVTISVDLVLRTDLEDCACQ